MTPERAAITGMTVLGLIWIAAGWTLLWAAVGVLRADA